MDKFKKLFNTRSLDLRELPDLINIELVMGCNLHCKMCPVPEIRENMNGRNATIMSKETFYSLLDQISDHPRQVYLNQLGEPLLNPHIVEFVVGAKSKGHWVSFTTNGTRLNKELSNQLVQAKLDQITFSVDGYKKETYENIRIGADYDQVINNIKYLAKINNRNGHPVMIHLDFIVSEKTKNEIRDFKKAYRKLVDKINFIPLDDWAGQLELSADWGKIPLREVMKSKRFPCHLLWIAVFVSAEGNMMLCCHDYKLKSGLANIREKNISAIWCDSMKSVRESHVTNNVSLPPCKGCQAWQRMPRRYSSIQMIKTKLVRLF